MSGWLVFSPSATGQVDELVPARWAAQQVLARRADAASLTDEGATRAGLEAALTPDIAGVAFYGHGNEDSLVGSDGPAWNRGEVYSPPAVAVAGDVLAVIRRQGFQPLAISFDHAERALRADRANGRQTSVPTPVPSATSRLSSAQISGGPEM